MPAVFGPYRKDYTGLGGASQFKDEERHRKDCDKAASEFEELDEVFHI